MPRRRVVLLWVRTGLLGLLLLAELGAFGLGQRRWGYGLQGASGALLLWQALSLARDPATRTHPWPVALTLALFAVAGAIIGLALVGLAS